MLHPGLRALRLGLSGLRSLALCLPGLTSLDLHGCHDLRCLALQCTSLRHLSCHSCRYCLAFRCLAMIRCRTTYLADITPSCNICTEGLHHSLACSCMPAAVLAALCHAWLTAMDIQPIHEIIHRLHVLCRALPVGELENALACCTHLETVDLLDSQADEGLCQRLQQRCPGLQGQPRLKG